MNGARTSSRRCCGCSRGRLVAIVGKGMDFSYPGIAHGGTRSRKYTVRANVNVNGTEYAKYGTTFDNNLLVIDKTGPTTGTQLSLAGSKRMLTFRPSSRESAMTAASRAAADLAPEQPAAEPGGGTTVAPGWSNPSPWRSVEPPTPTYTPNLPKSTITEGGLSDAQLEAVVYAGQAHRDFLDTGARRGFFIGDGTGVGKGREIAGIILDNWRQGRKKALWVSEKQKLLDDAKRDIGGRRRRSGHPSSSARQPSRRPTRSTQAPASSSRPTTTLRSAEKKQTADGGKVPARRGSQQIIDWLGDDFDGVIAFDESHNMRKPRTRRRRAARRRRRSRRSPGSSSSAGCRRRASCTSRPPARPRSPTSSTPIGSGSGARRRRSPTR
jgi:hypothetical protein